MWVRNIIDIYYEIFNAQGGDNRRSISSFVTLQNLDMETIRHVNELGKGFQSKISEANNRLVYVEYKDGSVAQAIVYLIKDEIALPLTFLAITEASAVLQEIDMKKMLLEENGATKKEYHTRLKEHYQRYFNNKVDIYSVVFYLV